MDRKVILRELYEDRQSMRGKMRLARQPCTFLGKGRNIVSLEKKKGKQKKKEKKLRKIERWTVVPAGGACSEAGGPLDPQHPQRLKHGIGQKV